MAKGYTKQPEIDYEEIFSPVVKFMSIRAQNSFAIQNGMMLHQMDVATAFLLGTLEEDIFMKQPDGYVE